MQSRFIHFELNSRNLQRSFAPAPHIAPGWNNSRSVEPMTDPTPAWRMPLLQASDGTARRWGRPDLAELPEE